MAKVPQRGFPKLVKRMRQPTPDGNTESRELHRRVSRTRLWITDGLASLHLHKESQGACQLESRVLGSLARVCPWDLTDLCDSADKAVWTVTW